MPPGELYAAPSADQLDGIAVCLLDAAPHAQRERLLARGDAPALIAHHLAFAEWMRQHAVDLRHRPEVLTEGSWERMRWERWLRAEQERTPWETQIIDTTALRPAEVSARVAAWVRQMLGSPAQGWR